MDSAPPPPYSEKPVTSEKTPPRNTANAYPQQQRNDYPPYQQGPPPPMVQPMYIGPPIIFGDYPVPCVCPACHRQIISRTEKKNGLLAWLICGTCFVFGLWVCCFIPFCVDSCRDTEHYCPSCNMLLGGNKKL